MVTLRVLAIGVFAFTALFAQRRLEPEQRHHRILCVVPLVGKGTYDDPRRPLFAPAKPVDSVDVIRAEEDTDREEKEPPRIIAYSFEESDDGKFAIVEFVAPDPEAFRPILESGRDDVKVFRKESLDKTAATDELKRYKREFELKSKGLAVQ